MDITISVADGVPIYRQIVNQIRYMVASGLLEPGEEIPPIRTLALQLRVTPNTIVKAYDELETAGILLKRRGAGTFGPACVRAESATIKMLFSLRQPTQIVIRSAIG